MKSITLLISIYIVTTSSDCFASENLGSYFYKELGCTEETTNDIIRYRCPDLTPKNGSCIFKNVTVKSGDSVDEEHLKGSCHASCLCSADGRIVCADYDCFQRLKSGCSHFKYSLDSCCAVDSVCGPIAKCEIEGKTYQEGNTVHLKEKCEICVCDVGFELKPPFCRPRKCYDQATYAHAIERNGAPAFFGNEKCCPNYWIVDEGQEVIKLNEKTAAVGGITCKFGDRKVSLGYGFKTKVMPYGEEISLVCECSAPPLLICKEQV